MERRDERKEAMRIREKNLKKVGGNGNMEKKKQIQVSKKK